MTTTGPSVGGRRAELAGNLHRVADQIAAAAAGCGRNAADIVLVVVTKTFPASDIRLLHELGVRDVGENRHGDAVRKVAELSDLELVWHFVGQVQSNKARAIAAYAQVVHSVDSERVAARLGAGAVRHDRVVDCLVQVNLDPPDGDPGRGGVPPDRLRPLSDVIGATAGLRLAGVMTVAPQGARPADAFARLADLHAEMRAVYPGATVMSAGMSGDFPAAIRAGATHVRVGSAVLGARAALR